MRKILYLIILLISGGVLFQYCVEPFDVEVLNFENALVVEGTISDEQKSHEIVLSRSFPIDTSHYNPETGASVWIENDLGTKIPFTEKKPGKYYSPLSFKGEMGRSYQLFIETADGSEYESEPVEMKPTPPIDSVYARFIDGDNGDTLAGVHENGVQIYVDTHDPQGNTNYYRWEWIGTYEIRVPRPSGIVYDPETRSFNQRLEDVSTCWDNDTSSRILVKTTANLALDRVSHFPIQFISENSQLIRDKYSILVKQYALSPESYFFWENMRKINESQGNLSDIQPGILAGNIQSVTNENETVLGYFEVASVVKKRLFVDPRMFYDEGFSKPSYSYDCEPIRVGSGEQVHELFTTTDFYEYLYYSIDPVNGGHFIAPYYCSNCSRFASNEMPDFWEE